MKIFLIITIFTIFYSIIFNRRKFIEVISQDDVKLGLYFLPHQIQKEAYWRFFGRKNVRQEEFYDFLNLHLSKEEQLQYLQNKDI